MNRVLRSALLLGIVWQAGFAAAIPIKVYKTTSCGCCGKWVEHLKANGFAPEVINVPSTAEARLQYGVPEQLRSCHTAVTGNYSIEGHVPAADIHRLLKEKTKGKGIATPGMPMGSPGMEGPRSDEYSVLLFQQDGTYTVFQKHPAK